MRAVAATRMAQRVRRGACAFAGLCLALVATGTAAADTSGDVRWQDTVTVAEQRAGWGRLARLPDGRWLAVVTRFHDDRPSTLEIAESRDRARTWAPIAEVAVPGRKLDNGELLALPDGDVLLAMRSLIDGVSYRLDVHRSRDRGRSWRHLSTIDRNEGPRGRRDRGLWEPTFTLLADGTLSVLYADETAADERPAHGQVVSQRLSRDGGASWGPKIRVAAQPGGGPLRPGMAVMARLREGGYLVLFEICGGEDRRCPVSMKTSHDGRTWTAGLGVPVPHQSCGPHVLATAEGRVFATSCANEIAWSDDGGRHWRRSAQPAWPFGFRHSWPALYQTAPGEIAAINNATPSAVKIRFGRFEATPLP